MIMCCRQHFKIIQNGKILHFKKIEELILENLLKSENHPQEKGLFSTQKNNLLFMGQAFSFFFFLAKN